MNHLWKGLGLAAAGLACWVAATGRAAERPEAPAPSYQTAAEPGGSRNTLRGTANGVGNTVIIDNGRGRSTTVLENSRSGVGNRVVIVDGEVVTDESTPEPARDGLKLGDVKFYSPLHGCTLYWNPRTLSWDRYDADREEYVPAEWDF